MSGESLSYETDLWDGFELSLRQSDDALDSCRELRDFFKRRAAIEEEYAKHLAVLCRKSRVGRGSSSTGGDPDGPHASAQAADRSVALHDHKTVAAAWSTVLSETERCSSVHAAFGNALKDEVSDPLANFVTAMKANRESLTTEGNKLSKLLQESRENLQRAHAAFDKACRDVDELKLSTKKKDMAKVDGKEQVAREREYDYRTAIKNTNYFQDKFCNEKMPEIQRGFQQMEEKRVDIVKDGLVSFLTALYKLPECHSACYKAIHAAVKGIDRKGDIQEHIRASRTGKEKPPPYEFRPYSADSEPVEKLGLRATLRAKGAQFLKNRKGGGGGGGGASEAQGPSSASGAGSASALAAAVSPAAAAEGNTFGCTLARAAENGPGPGGLPRVLTSLGEAIVECGGLTTEGIFRIPADRGEVEALKARLDRLDFDIPGTDPHVPAGALKLWLRELKDPLIPDALYDQCLAVGADADPNAARDVVDALPELNRKVVRYMGRLLSRFALPENSAVSKMTAPNLAMVFAPGFLRYSGDNPAALLTNNNNEKACVLQLIENEAGQDPDADLSKLADFSYEDDETPMGREPALSAALSEVSLGE